MSRDTTQAGFAAFARRLRLIRVSSFRRAVFGTLSILRNAQSSRSIGVLPCGSGIGIFAFTYYPPDRQIAAIFLSQPHNFLLRVFR
jgi:hypothetical protein